MPITIKDKNRCSGCTACAAVCPKNCIKMVLDEEGFLYPFADKDSCIDCGLCERVCPIGTPLPKPEHDINCFAVCNNDKEVRQSSSSGGVFFALAKEIIADGGAVFGAAFDEEMKVSHICVREESRLCRLMGSKYVQSDLKNSFLMTKELLESNVPVLFSGTPCQTDGLVSFLKKDYVNLFVVDVVCHGAPSPAVWEKYLEYNKQKQGADVTGFCFRDKSTGWKNYAVTARFCDGSDVSKKHHDDLYMKAFLHNISLRPSCYACGSKSPYRVADISLGDFWGIQSVAPHMDDDAGTSLVMLHTKKGKELFDRASINLLIQQVPFEQGVEKNPSFHTSSPLNPRRKEFFKGLKNTSFDKLVQKCLVPPLRLRIKNKLRSFLKK